MIDKEYLLEITKISEYNDVDKRIKALDKLNKKYKLESLEVPIIDNFKNNGKSSDWGCLPGYRRDKKYKQVR